VTHFVHPLFSTDDGITTLIRIPSLVMLHFPFFPFGASLNVSPIEVPLFLTPHWCPCSRDMCILLLVLLHHLLIP